MKYFKKGQTVYHSDYGQGKVVELENIEFAEDGYPILVEFIDSSIHFTEDGRRYKDSPISLSQTPILEVVNVPLGDTYVPFTFEDRELLRGEWVSRKTTKGEFMIIYIGNLKVGLDGSYYTYQELFNDFEFIDEKPCGKIIN